MVLLTRYKINKIIHVFCIFSIMWITACYSSSPTWTIVRIPVTLKKGQSLSHSFVTNRTFKFQIQLDVKINKDSVSHLNRLLTDEIDIDWKVLTDHTSIASGHASGPMIESVWGGGRARRVLGEFNGIDGEKYTLELKINKTASNLIEADPQIRIEPDGELYKTGKGI